MMIMTNTTAEANLFAFVQAVKIGYLAQTHNIVFDRILSHDVNVRFDIYGFKVDHGWKSANCDMQIALSS